MWLFPFTVILLEKTFPTLCLCHQKHFCMGGLKEPLWRDICISTLYIQYILICKKPFAYMHGTTLHSLKKLLLKEVWLHLFHTYFQNSDFILEGCSQELHYKYLTPTWRKEVFLENVMRVLCRGWVIVANSCSSYLWIYCFSFTKFIPQFCN